MMKAIGFFLANWLSVILFIAGLTFLDLAAFNVNFTLGLLVAGLALITMALAYAHERG
ncbi:MULTISPECIES: hypothetical protein [Lactiplantibacillus]|uniref:Uncharacterized protein n=2 Tax=Lactiplantibacillus pentosus TaxID=1589 RepID=A0AAW8VXC5_LACPE|nr:MULTISPECIES: hypothetical protein [Lactiplantibacillus]MBU7461202.1 hypothetical protein [Lactiplantibacillus pentosus]MBU7476956.1 hypothetical protein [Lactiplantibacillus pentosus]MBU7481610.1 hypothetical protein [Lactiplantibacillus pentosus]MBU7483880.1 hypothetical protein [Lactiplantibacillus sp. 30.2.29]MBU7487101.1 hypothetical protein [Lactiplantibacillus pentosus]